VVDLTNIDPLSGAIWDLLLDLAAEQLRGWTLVGAQMVSLHGRERNRVLPRATTDADVLVDVRLVQDATSRLCQLLVKRGFDLDGISAMGIGHRLTDGRVKVDVLAPDVRVRSQKTLTTIPPARTVCVPGGSQALHRSRLVDVQRDERTGQVPCPDLLGAILIKTRAVDVDDLPDAQRGDLAFLLSLVGDPRALAAELRGKERSWLRRRAELLERGHPAWKTLGDEEAANGYSALRILAGT
jgi:hypothetical protein